MKETKITLVNEDIKSFEFKFDTTVDGHCVGHHGHYWVNGVKVGKGVTALDLITDTEAVIICMTCHLELLPEEAKRAWLVE